MRRAGDGGFRSLDLRPKTELRPCGRLGWSAVAAPGLLILRRATSGCPGILSDAFEHSAQQVIDVSILGVCSCLQACGPATITGAILQRLLRDQPPTNI